jgi:hypothetical protein
MKVACIAGDPGGARSLNPVIAELIHRGMEVQLTGYRQGFSVLKEHGLPVVLCDELLALNAETYLRASKADLLLSATSMNGEDYEKSFMQAATQISLPSIGILDFWSNYRGRFSTHSAAEQLNALPDRIAVMDARAVEEMVALGFPKTRLVITGQPAFDELFLPRNIPAVRHQIRTALGLCKSDLLLIFASQPFSEITAESGIAPVGYDEMECLHLLIKSLRATGKCPKIWVRPHPRETVGKFSALTYPSLIISSEFDRISAILAADGVAGMSSNFLLEAALIDVPVLSIQPRQAGPGPLPLVGLNRGQVITEIHSLQAGVSRWISDCSHHRPLPHPVALSPFGPGAAARVAEVALNLLGCSSSLKRNLFKEIGGLLI